MKRLVKSSLIGLMAAFTSLSANAELLFNFSGTGNSQADAGFEMAANNISSLFTDDLVINIDTEFKSLGTNILGQASSTNGFVDFDVWKDALANDSTSTKDQELLNSLPTGDAFSVYINGTADNPNGAGSSLAYVDDDNGLNNTRLNLTSANAKALGLKNGYDSEVDATISFSNDFLFDFDPTDGISAGHIDFVGVATHEILHAMGFVSGVDTLDYYTGVSENAGLYNDDAFQFVTGLDFLRHSSASYSSGADLDFTADTRSKYLSFDGGDTIYESNAWATGVYNGDGTQASHWKDHQEIGIMDPTADSAGNAMDFHDEDLLAMDVIGWNLAISPNVSVPAPLGAGLLALGVAGMFSRRKGCVK